MYASLALALSHSRTHSLSLTKLMNIKASFRILRTLALSLTHHQGQS